MLRNHRSRLSFKILVLLFLCFLLALIFPDQISLTSFISPKRVPSAFNESVSQIPSPGQGALPSPSAPPSDNTRPEQNLPSPSAPPNVYSDNTGPEQKITPM